MKRRSAPPRRLCLGCRQSKPKSALVRLVRAVDGVVRIDVNRTAPGRGAYICPDGECVERALRGARLGHAFRKPSEAGSDLGVMMRTRVRSAVGASGSRR